MKKIFSKSVLIIAVLGFLSSSCSDDFLNTLPTEDVSAESITATTANLMLGINGIHRSLYLRFNSQGEGGLGGMMIMTDMLGEDLVMTTTGNGWYNATYRWIDHTNANDGDNLYHYRVYYRFIRNANVIINGADGAVGDADERNVAKGQALFYRAFSHFQLVQLYGGRYVGGQPNTQLGVPIRTTADNEPLARATVEEVYAQVNADLDEAISLLSNYTRPNKSHIDAKVATGLKARVALVQQNYPLAAQLAAAARTGFTLMDEATYQLGFNDYTNPEWMWGSHIIEDQTTFFANFGAYMSRNFSSTNIRTNPKAIFSVLYNQIPSTDVRSKIFDPTGQHLNLPAGATLPSNFAKFPFTSQKFIAVSTADSRMDVPYMRMAEMFLIEAEALSFSNEAAARQALFQLVSKRDPAYTLSTNSGQALKDEIELQRRIELWGEGFRFYDLKRLNKALDRTGGNHTAALTGNVFQIPAGATSWQWLIPQNELNSNPLVVQNPN